jgi:hypothetical protein
VRMEAWRQWLLGEEKKPCPMTKAPLDSDRPSHGRRLHALTANHSVKWRYFNTCGTGDWKSVA